MTDFKAQLPANIGGLFCSTDDGRIFAVQLGSHLYVALVVNSVFAITFLSVRFLYSCLLAAFCRAKSVLHVCMCIRVFNNSLFKLSNMFD